MKRSLSSVFNNTRSKKPKLLTPLFYSDNNHYVSATSIYNYMVNDTLVDWLKLRSVSNTKNISHSSKVKNNDKFSDYILEKGILFEENIVKYINDNIHPVVKVSEYITPSNCEQTLYLMKNGTPIIHSAPVINKNNKTKGVIDLLVRSDYINNITTLESLSDEEKTKKASKLGNPYHYVVIDIKFSTLPLRSDGKHIQNANNFSAYKSQLLIYNQAIGRMQGYTPPYAFILGRRTKYTKSGITNTSYNSLERLGRIDYNNLDKEYLIKTKKAIKWVRNVNQNSTKWTCTPPSTIELYPNMCKDSGIRNKEKNEIAMEIGEITMIWNVGQKHRNIALKKGIKSWRDPKCTAENLGITGKNSVIIDKIMNINRQNKIKLLPEKIKNNKHNWKNNKNNLFIDFETMSDIFTDFSNLPVQNKTDMIFMIGVGWCENDKWHYNSYTCKESTYEEEFRIMDEFISFINSRDNPVLNYWCAEANFWDKAENRQYNLTNDIDRKNHISDNWKIEKWCNLYDIFKEDSIVIKDCFNFGLKSIAKAMKKHDMITTELETDCTSGISAMVKAYNCYKKESNPSNCVIMNDICKYNEFDCKVLWEIMTYLKNNNI
jgi:hypothetical protein